MPLIAKVETTMGTMMVQLFDAQVPNTVANFAHLASSGFYNGLKFHRVIADFMIQGGCPKGDGTGGPGWHIADEFVPALKHDREGVLSMANAGPNTNGSQFFITLEDTPWLDGKHTVFGRVVKGLDVLKAIGAVKTDSGDRPVEPVKITRVTLFRDAEKLTGVQPKPVTC
jgi:cyclophilin family peptidyl-prolyl cis-trans isomerase